VEQIREFPFPIPNSLSRQPPGLFWWNDRKVEKEQYRQSFGSPEDFVLVGRESFHDVECDVYLNSAGNQADRFYFGLKDQRWYGAKEGIIAFGDLPTYEKRYRATVEEFLGAGFDGKITSKTWEKLALTLRKLPQARKILWCKLLYDRVSKDYTPCFEYFFSDFRDLGNGRVMPFHQDFLQYEHEGDTEIFLGSTQSFDIVQVIIDQPLDDRLFQLMPDENDKRTASDESKK
jgi:hypothetical protein